MNAPRSYADIKELAKTTGRRIPDLLAMASINDPFYIMPAQAKQGEWFAALWERFDFPHGVHLRRIHYKLISQPDPVLMVDGRPYQNTELCWQYLGNASKAARCLRLVDPTAFEDKRNPDAVIVRRYEDSNPEPEASIDNLDEWALPEIQVDLADDLDWAIPRAGVSGYDYRDNDKPFHLELISEKSTMDDVVIPLCQRLGVNYAPATGFQSITGVIALLNRLREANKSGIVFYVSDLDPAGSFMPPSVARQIEFWRPVYAPGLDILVTPVVLTKEQVLEYGLPPIPIRETDKRQNNFLAKYGVEGATELDALEALHPGELARIIRQAVAPYHDTQIAQRLKEAEEEADEAAREAWSDAREVYGEQLKALKKKTRETVAGYRDRLESLRQAMNADLEPVKEELDGLRQAIKADMDKFDPELPPRPESDLTLPEKFAGLFDSRRDYMDQLQHYKTAASSDSQND